MSTCIRCLRLYLHRPVLAAWSWNGPPPSCRPSKPRTARSRWRPMAKWRGGG